MLTTSQCNSVPESQSPIDNKCLSSGPYISVAFFFTLNTPVKRWSQQGEKKGVIKRLNFTPYVSPFCFSQPAFLNENLFKMPHHSNSAGVNKVCTGVFLTENPQILLHWLWVLTVKKIPFLQVLIGLYRGGSAASADLFFIWTPLLLCHQIDTF